MKKVFVLLMLGGTLSGCHEHEVESEGYRYNVICLNGVEYYAGFRSVAVVYNTDGTISLCEEESDERDGGR